MSNNSEGKVVAETSQTAADYAYPADLARFVRDRWRDVPEPPNGIDLLPDAGTLEGFFSVCYHASLLREEERPVIFRAILAAPTLFASEGRPPDGLQRLEFSSSLPFGSRELRQLSVAADPRRTLIGVGREGDRALRIWGVINSGTRWLRDIQGGRQAAVPLPPAPVIHVDSPGSLEAYKGYELIGKLQGGRLSGVRADPFGSAWLPGQFSGLMEELMKRHEAARTRAGELSGESWARLEPTLARLISERMMKRVIAMLRDARHGGTIIFIPEENAQELSAEDPYIDLKYRFPYGPKQLYFTDLVVDILNRIAQLHGGSDQRRQEPIGWREFEATTDDEIATLDEALFETAHLIAGLAAADGAVVFSKRNHKLLGFGGMISGRLPAVRRVAKALDLEGERIAEEETGNVGARHRSAYRLAGALPGAVAIVVSQDGGVRFICQKGERVTYWEQE